MKYKKIPVEIEAEQFIIWDFNNVPTYTEIFGQKYIIKGSLFNRYIEIPTLEGIMRANVNDYIIKGVKDEIYPCKPDIFEMTYEKISEQDCEKCNNEGLCGYIPKHPDCTRCKYVNAPYEFCKECIGVEDVYECKFKPKVIK